MAPGKNQSRPAKGRTRKQTVARKPAGAVIREVSELARPLCESEGLELVFVEYQREAAGRILRIYIDRPDGITLEDCVAVSRQMSDLLDVHLEEVGPYNLEVTSPGTDRPLGKLDDYRRFEGHEARIRTSRPLGGQKNFKGILAGVSENSVALSLPGKTISIPFDTIVRARLVNYDSPSAAKE